VTIRIRGLTVRERRLAVFAWQAGVTAMSLVGWMLATWAIATAWSQAGFDAHTYRQAGFAMLAGTSPYSGEYGGLEGFRYAPPLAILSVPAALVPFDVFKAGLLGLNVAALRFVAGSWRWAGLVLLYPWSINELFVGNINFPIAAAMYAAFRGSTAPLAFAGLAKISPFFVVPMLLRRGRPLGPALVTLVGALVLTAPALWLWPAWLSALSSTTTPAGALPVPLVWRLALAVVLLAAAWYGRRDWMAVLGATISLPVLWPSALVVLLAPIRLLIESLRPDRRFDRPEGTGPSSSQRQRSLSQTPIGLILRLRLRKKGVPATMRR
jgi:hypothetical protein